MVGLLDAGEGATLSFDSAAWLWALPGFAPTPVHVTALRDTHRRPSDLLVIHEPRRLFPSHITFLDGFATTSIVRTIFDLAAVLHPLRVKRLVHLVVRRSPGTLPIFHRMLDELAVKGRRGITTMRQVLRDLPEGSVPAESGTELRFEEILETAGERPLRRQVNLGGHEFLGRVDYYDDLLDLVFEINSRTYHFILPDDVERDARRADALEATGARVVGIPESLVWRDPSEVLRVVRSERQRRRAELLVVEP